MGRTRIVVAVVGVVVVTLYAVLLAVQQLVLDPLAAVPGTSLGAIHAHLERQGFDVRGDVVAVIVTAAIGVALAIVVATTTLWKHVEPHFVAAWMLGIIAAGAVPFFFAGFQLGMDVADGYGVSGGAHTVWAGVLFVTSAIALVAIPVVLVFGERRRALRATSETLVA
ncbi:hypothetical protein DEJ28_16565 [Curtobacterium sp. MCPF17_002]|uniref:hypothetical protein n=1 Tax=Curtobacterium sp. MCPF17_002 TaxID=2175645 RepID=UPI0011B66D62|nr:hypothetical protein [Curtobacterium sp. MCPF17_002]WIB77233.1 hypothetical protein DEJ28_16565 [Curtobacterium sp. MCPF17_002]